MVKITPIILAKTKEEFKKKIENKALRKAADVWQIDVLDSTLFGYDSWADAMNAGDIDLPHVELHLMTNDPIPYVEDWDDMTSAVRRAIVHAEMLDPQSAIEEIKAMEVECGIALAPETDLEDIELYADLIDTILVLGVKPGASGQTFLGENILKKVQRSKQLYPNKEIAVDGGVNISNAESIIHAGADRLCVASVLWNSEDPAEVFRQLDKM